MRVAYVRWRDALHSMEDTHVTECGLVELEEVGFLIYEDEERITLAIEAPLDDRTRMWLSIPRVNIIDLRIAELEKAFPVRRRKRK